MQFLREPHHEINQSCVAGVLSLLLVSSHFPSLLLPAPAWQGKLVLHKPSSQVSENPDEDMTWQNCREDSILKNNKNQSALQAHYVLAHYVNISL